MNKILLTGLIFLSFSFLANAQFSKGSILLGGSINYSDSKYTSNVPSSPEQKYNQANFSVSAGKAISENAVVGLILGYATSSTTNYSEFPYGPQPFRTNEYSIGVFYRKYKGLGKDFYLFGEADAFYSGGNQSTKDSTGSKISSVNSNGGSAAFQLGISYKISKKFMLDLSLPSLFSVSYSSNKSSSQGVTTSNDQFAISTSLTSSPLSNLAIGFRLIL
jgi:hypothetical protein